MARYFYRPGHPKADKITGFVSAEDLAQIPMDPPRALDAPVLSGRFYENTPPATDGTPIDSRSKHRAYMKAAGFAHASDYGKDWDARVAAKKEREFRQQTRATVEKLVHLGPKHWGSK